MTTSIICGIDGSQDARLALRFAAQLATRVGARLVVAHVVQPSVPAAGLGPTAHQLEMAPTVALVAGGEALVDQILAEENISQAARRVVLGFPADRLADLADEESAELILVGSRGRGPSRLRSSAASRRTSLALLAALCSSYRPPRPKPSACANGRGAMR